VSPYELRYDPTNAWVSKPGPIVQHAIYQYLQATDSFETVTTTVSPPPDLRLDAYVAVLEEDTTDGTSVARLEISLVLRAVRNGSVLHRETLKGQTDLSEGGAAQTVAALSDILNKELARVAPAIADAASAHMAAAEGEE
jgi:ABC-type uncharacterized transport system auxiliary subunit